MSEQFETDGKGNLILNPLTDWVVAPVAEVAVLLRVQYSKEGSDIAGSVQLVLKPRICLELAEALSKQANRILHDTLPPWKAPN
jgi:hypothetical protein